MARCTVERLMRRLRLTGARRGKLQRQITEGLDVVEAFNGASSVIYYGKGGEIASNREDEQAVLEKAAG